MANLASIIKTERTRRGLSAAKFADEVGVSQMAVWNWENGKTHPRAEALARIAKVLGVSQETLAGKSNGAGVASLSQRRPLHEVVAEAKANIAAATGLPLDRIKINLDLE
jgi:transcriptional regulator with XRE-family HTH domain